MKKIKLFFFAGLICISKLSFSQTLPKPDHILIVFNENHAFEQIIGDTIDAPYINSLAKDTDATLFTQYYALTHPSQPNYLMLFSGSTQNVVGDDITTIEFTTCNLGASLIDSGFSFIGYSEEEPSVGYLGTTYLDYARKHNPWSNWQGSTQNAIPSGSNAPYTLFPTNFDSLPTLSYVMPDLNDDMHNGTIAEGDMWLKNNISSYATWAKTHNSLLIFTFDEDDNYHNNHIATIFVGQMVKAGIYSDTTNNYNLLRTIEDMYGLPYCTRSALYAPITKCWASAPAGVEQLSINNNRISIYPNPTNDLITITSAKNIDAATVTNLLGQIELKLPAVNFGVRQTIDVSTLSSGMYFVTVKAGNSIETKKIIVSR